MLTDADIMQRVQAGDTQLFALLVGRYRPRLLRFACSKLAEEANAEDVVQETFLAAFSARDSYQPQFAFSTWLWTILINLSRRSLRQAARREARQEEFVNRTPPPTHDAACALTIMLQQERQDRVHAWLAKLPEAEADAIRLRFFGELSFDEIAAAMDSSVSGAKARVHRGLIRLAQMAVDEH